MVYSEENLNKVKKVLELCPIHKKVLLISQKLLRHLIFFILRYSYFACTVTDKSVGISAIMSENVQFLLRFAIKKKQQQIE